MISESVLNDITELKKHNASLWNLGFETIKDLETEKGILASGKDELFGCIFGRDSLITALKLLRIYEKNEDIYFLHLVKKILQNLADLQGKEVNIESGEEPGKCIHEFRPSNHEHLTKNNPQPWYVYEDNSMRNYDSIDSTPLLLVAFYRYWQMSKDENFLDYVLPNITAGLEWLLKYSDKNHDSFLDYALHPDRKFGGLTTQSWMDSGESVFHEDGSVVAYPIAPVEAQSYAFLAYKLWASFFMKERKEFAEKLLGKANELKQNFNTTFILEDEHGIKLATGIDGNGKLLTSTRSSMGHCLWASLEEGRDGMNESIVDEQYIPEIVQRLMKPDMFEYRAGIRTLSTFSSGYSSNSYHNGSIWPHDTSMIAEGFEIFGFLDQSLKVRVALLTALLHFNSPVELFVFADNVYSEYCSPSGQKACKNQAWSAATLLKEVHLLNK